jgi:hypothetical protein
MKTLTGLLLAAAVILASGCLERKMTITSAPSGAMVTMSDVEIGRTPVTIPFTWYGDYDIILRLDGYQTLKTHERINPPIQEIPPFDIFCEILPWTIKDYRYLDYKMEKAKQPATQELIDRALKLEARNKETVKR